MPRRAAIVLPHPVALLLVLVAMTAPLVPETHAIETLPDAGWWSSYAKGPVYWVPERVELWNGLPVAWSWGGGPHAIQGSNLNRLEAGCWTELSTPDRCLADGWCVWRGQIVGLFHAPYREDADQARAWNGAAWVPLIGHVPSWSGPLVAMDDRLLLGSPSGVYEWKDGDWRRLGPAINVARHHLFLLQGDPVTVDPRGGGVLRLHAGQWRSYERLPVYGWDLPRPVLVDGRLYAAASHFEPIENRGRGRVLRLDGDRWSPVGEEFDGMVTALFDDHGQVGVAAELIELDTDWQFHGSAGFLMRWDGGSWVTASPLVNGPIEGVAFMEDHPIAAGYYTAAGEVEAPGIARLDAGVWRPVEEVPNSGTDGIVHSMTTYRGELVVAGGFLTLAGQVVAGIAAGGGARWHPLGGGLNDAVFALTEFQGGLIAGGEFTKAGDDSAACVARWDGTAWHPLGAGFDDRVQALGLYHGELYAGGWFTHSGTRECRGIARWDGVAWVPVAGGVDDHVTSFAQFNDELVVGGEFRHAGGTAARYLARYDGATWRTMPAEVNGGVLALSVWRDRLVAGGHFHRAGTVAAPAVAFWDGAAWSAPTAVGYPSQGWAVSLGNYQGDLVVGWDSGNIPAPFPNNNFAIWSGRDWRVPETVATGAVRAVAQFGQSLFIGGDFKAAGGHPAQNLARWDGTLVGAPLTESSAFRNGATAELGWSAPGVSNHTGYEVWRESGGRPRVKLGFVAAAVEGRYAFSDEAPEAGAADYWLRELGPAGGEEWRGPISLAPLPPGVQLRVPTPNPFSASTALTFTLERAGRIGLRVFDVQGRPLRTLLDGTRPAGVYTQEWDGRDDNGAAVATGFYWLRVSYEAGSAARRVLYLR